MVKITPKLPVVILLTFNMRSFFLSCTMKKLQCLYEYSKIRTCFHYIPYLGQPFVGGFRSFENKNVHDYHYKIHNQLYHLKLSLRHLLDIYEITFLIIFTNRNFICTVYHVHCSHQFYLKKKISNISFSA